MEELNRSHKYFSIYEEDLIDFRFDLQIFAAEDEGRTEDPTEKKIREAREKGQVARTQELPQAIVVILGFVVFFFMGSFFLHTIVRITSFYLKSFSGFYITEKSILNELYRLVSEMVILLWPIFAVVLVAALVGNLIQVGFQVSTHPLKWDWKKIKFDPATIFKKIFFSKQVGMNLFKSIFKVVAIGVVAYLIILNDYDIIMRTPDISVGLAFRSVSIIAFKVIIWTSVLLLVLSIPDYIFQKKEFIESLKMTKEEVKEELKETVGDPYIRARLREMQREIVMRNMISEVPKADVIITNPTHYAVALLYDSIVMDAPKVIAKGVDSMALRIIKTAKENDIFIIENRPMAQELYHRLNVGDIIPDELFYAVSLIYAEFYRKKKFREAV